MKVLVTGGAGFIGSNVVAEMLSAGFQVCVVDDLSSGYLQNIKHLIDHNDIEFINGDIRDEQLMQKACKGIDGVCHLAASVGRQRSIDYPIADSSINLLGTVNVLESMRKNGVKHIVYSSSAAIFGELQHPTIDENHPQNADSPYGVSKLAAEKMILAYCDIHGLSAVCLRYFNIYGVNQRFDMYGNVIPIFAKRIFSGQPITIYGDGTQTRDFVNVKDVARANRVALTSNKRKEIYNVGSGSSITINNLAKRMINLGAVPTDIVYAPERAADVKHCKANADKSNAS